MMKHPHSRLTIPLLTALTLGTPTRVSRAEVVPAEETVQPVATEVDPSTIEAFQNYWDAFQQEDRSRAESSKREIETLREAADRDVATRGEELETQREKSLQAATANYRKQLKDHPESRDQGSVRQNLAQVLIQRANKQEKTSPKEARELLTQAESVLIETLTKSVPGSVKLTEPLYLLAGLQERLGKKEEAAATWKRLAAQAEDALFVVHARLAVGDEEFRHKEYAKALTSYDTASRMLDRLAPDTRDAERTRVDYRIAWSAYKAGNQPRVLEATASLLAAGRHFRSAEIARKMREDAARLAGDALYEQDNTQTIDDTLARADIKDHTPAIALQLVRRYGGNNIDAQATRVAEALYRDAPDTREIPEAMWLAALSYERMNQERLRMRALERIALLLAPQSLWRARYKDEPDTLRTMVEIAQPAARIVAAWNYDRGLSAANPTQLANARAFYEILIDNAPTHSDAATWRLRRANAAYFSDNLASAEAEYLDLKTNYTLTDELLQKTSFQLVMTRDKLWRKAFADAAARGSNAREDAAVIQRLKGLEISIEEFANRFASTRQAVDLLLAGASANRDHERFTNASRFWQRALVSSPTSSQRATAIRGLVMAETKTGTPTSMIATTTRFLRLESQKSLDDKLRGELEAILSVALAKESERLAHDGKTIDAGLVLTSHAEEFLSMPKREELWRDGTRLLGLAGQWDKVEKTTDRYLKERLTKVAGDMLYLNARASEFQMRFKRAVASYLSLARHFPGHTSVDKALARAEELAVQENTSLRAGEAAEIQGERAEGRPAKLAHWARAMNHYAQARDTARGVSLGQKRLRSSQTTSEKLAAELSLAKVRWSSGKPREERQALTDLASFVKKLDHESDRLSKKDYAALSGEAWLILGDEARRDFESDRIASGKNMARTVNEKARGFEKLAARLERSAKSGVPAITTEARYKLARAAESFADELSAIPSHEGFSTDSQARRKIEGNVERLRALAVQYHSQNVMDARRGDKNLAANEWVRRSAQRMSGTVTGTTPLKSQEALPDAVGYEMPYQWSH